MKKGVVAAVLLSVMGAMSCALGANPPTGKNSGPQITAQDLAACKNEIAEFHRREISYLKNDALDYCTKGKDTHYNPDNCRMANEWVRQSSNTSDLAWFMKGNDSCDASDYTCFGISIFNDGMDEETARDLAKHPLPPTALSESGEPWDYSGFNGYYLVVHGCIAKVYVAKLEAKNRANASQPKPAIARTAALDKGMASAAVPGAKALPESQGGASLSAKLDLPKPAKGAVDAPVILGTSTSGPTRINGKDSTTTLALAAPSRSRTLTLPAELASLKPADVFIDFFNDGGINVFVGRTYDAALAADRYIGARNTGDEKSSCSQILGKTTVAWFAILRVAHQLPPAWTNIDHHYTSAFVCGAASMEEAIAAAYDLAKANAAGRPFKTFALQAAVSAEVDPKQLQKEKRLHNGLRPVGLAPWTFNCSLPLDLDEAQATFMPRDPGSGPAFVQYVKSLPETREYRYRAYNMDRSNTYDKTTWLGCKGYYHTPLPNQGPPVFAPR